MLRRLARLVGLLLLLFPIAVGAAYFDRQQGKFLEIIDEVSYRSDNAVATSFEAVFADPQGWLLQKNTPFPLTKDPIAIWARFELPEVLAVRRVFIDSSAWERVEFFVVRDGRLVDRQLQGTLVPLAERATRITMTTAFSHSGFARVDLLPGSRTTVFARLTTDQTHIPIFRLRFRVWDAELVLEGERRDRMIEGIYLGVMLVLIVYNLGLYFVIREPSYLFYVIAQLASLMFWSTYFGMTSEGLWPAHPSWDFSSLWIAMMASIWGLMHFVRHYFDAHKHFPTADVLLNRMSYIGIVLILLSALPLGHTLAKYGVYVMAAVSTVALSITFGVIVLALHRRHPLAPHLFSAILAAFLGFFVTIAAFFELLPSNDWTIHASQLGSAITGIMLSMGLGFRLRHTRKALAEKQIEEAHTQSRHERERRELIEEHNRGLEAKVVERTAELVASQQQSDTLLANILPKAIIAELKAKGVSEPRRHEDTSILFTDFSGFTQAVSTIPAKRLVQELDEIFRGFDDIVTNHGLEKIKTIGDAYMIASGLPDASADHAVRCVRAGLALTRFIEERNQTAAMKWGLRVGVHSGAVVAGIVGKNKYVYDVWGDTVNIANRMESGGEVNKVNISAYTYDLVRDHFDCEYRGKMAAKGKGEIDMYFVLRERVAGDGSTSNVGQPHDP